MTASRGIGGALQRGGNALDAPVAALAGLSVAFAAFAAPAEMLDELVRAAGVARFIPAAEPPLGFDARIGIGAAGAVAVFAITFLLLRWLGRFGGRRVPADHAEVEFDVEMPRLRRRDFHPDAAPRPPLFASAELGEPEPETVPLEAEAEPAAQAEPVAEAAAPPAPAPTPVHGHSIGELLERLEQGLARRRVAAEPSAAAPPAEMFPNAADDRLRSAIDSLQRLAARQD